MVDIGQILGDPIWGPQAQVYLNMGVPLNQIIQLFGLHVEKGSVSGQILTQWEDPIIVGDMVPIPVITGPVPKVPIVPRGSLPGFTESVSMGAIVSVYSILNSIGSYGALQAVWGIISSVLSSYGIIMMLDEAWEMIVGGEGLRLPFEVDEALKAVVAVTGGGASMTAGLHSAPGWSEKTCTKYVRRQAKQYQAMYKPMKDFTNAEKNGYSMGHRVASVWWSKALRRAKRRSYRAGQRKMQMRMMMMGRGAGQQIMIDS